MRGIINSAENLNISQIDCSFKGLASHYELTFSEGPTLKARVPFLRQSSGFTVVISDNLLPKRSSMVIFRAASRVQFVSKASFTVMSFDGLSNKTSLWLFLIWTLLTQDTSERIFSKSKLTVFSIRSQLVKEKDFQLEMFFPNVASHSAFAFTERERESKRKT